LLTSPSRYVPEFVQKEELVKQCSLYRNETVRVYSFGPLSRKTWDFIILAIHVLNEIHGRKDNVAIALLYSRMKKVIPYDATYLQATDVNSGVSIPSSQVCVIYRREEMHKVILHELMHIWGVDCASSSTQDRVIQDRLGIQCDGDLCMRESYNDAMTCLYLVALRVYMKHGKITRSRYIEDVNLGKQWITHVAQNVLRFYKNKPWIEKTHVFAYYIGKALIFSNINAFFKWSDKMHTDPNDLNILNAFSCPNFYQYIMPLCTWEYIQKHVENVNVLKFGDIKTLRMFCKPT